MSWARRRKLVIVLIVLAVILPVVAFFTYPFFYKAPTCADGVLNGSETGIDCGGACAYMCQATLAPLTTEFTRALTLVPGVYTAVAYVTNSNPGAYAPTVMYSLELYDEKNIFITEQKGSTYVLPGRTTPIVETNIRTGSRIPTRAFLTIDDAPHMKDMKRLTLTTLTVSDSKLTGEKTLPRLEARISNPSLSIVKDVETFAVIFDTKGTVRAASKSKIASIDASGNATTIFTWPAPFDFTVGKIDIIPRTRPL